MLHLANSQVTPGDLVAEVVLREPQIRQPAFFRFDPRGRLWVVNYCTYPEPAGLRIVSRDRYWRNVYDRVPPPPSAPGYVRGADRITIHEDSDGDGKFDHTTVFLDGLNLTTSFAFGNRGVYVLQPPYLLHYPDPDSDDVPDGDPTVLLEGFGIEDTHALANALTWGPDGWLYGAQGSTVTSRIRVPGSGEAPVKRVGQLIWRYHPERCVYEVFAEGGGNLWSCEFDSKGRLFAGHNGGTPGVYYLQGGYYGKSFKKHGNLSNPYAYGHLPPIEHRGWKRLSPNIAVYEGGSLPRRYEGALLWSNSIQNQVGASSLKAEGLNFTAVQTDLLLSGDAPNFRPVFTDFGPDGSLYIADWRDLQINHYRNHEGQINRGDGRIYRVREKGRNPDPPPDLGALSANGLVGQLANPNRWVRETARRLLWEHQDRPSVDRQIVELTRSADPQLALEALWVLGRGSPESSEILTGSLKHPDAHVRAWAVRLLSDQPDRDKIPFPALVGACGDPSLEVRAALATTARVSPRKPALEILANLVRAPVEPGGPQLSQLVWWALEEQVREAPEDAVDLLVRAREHPSDLIDQTLAPNLAKRLLAEPSLRHYRACIRLFDRSSPDLRAAMARACIDSLPRQAAATLPEELLAHLRGVGHAPLAFEIRLGRPGAAEAALARLDDPATTVDTLLEVLSAFSGGTRKEALPAVLRMLDHSDVRVVRAALGALFGYGQDHVGQAVTDRFLRLGPDLQPVAASLLTSRASWARIWLEAIRNQKIAPRHFSAAAREAVRHLDDEQVLELAGAIPTNQPNNFETEIARVTKVLSQQVGGSPIGGRQIYLQRCASCHHLHGEGGRVGPDLTPYQRNNLKDLLLAIIHPGAEVREGYQTVTARTDHGQTLTGFLVDETPAALVLRPVGGNDIQIQRKELEKFSTSGKSLMPAGLLSGLTDTQLRALFAYLASPQPLNLKTD